MIAGLFGATQAVVVNGLGSVARYVLSGLVLVMQCHAFEWRLDLSLPRDAIICDGS
jgi:hypothetical protein